MSGIYLSFLHKKKLSILKRLCDFFYEFGQLCSIGTYDIPDCFEKLSSAGAFSELTFINDILSLYSSGENLKEIWYRSADGFCPFYLEQNAKQQLHSFGDVLGKVSKESFLERCEAFSSAFKKMAEKEELRWEKNRDITVYSGLLVAAAVFFIFI